MIVNVYAIKDLKLGYEAPFTRVNDQLAIRDFQLCLNSSTPNKVSMTPADFELWKLGTLNIETGVLTSDLTFLYSGIITEG